MHCTSSRPFRDPRAKYRIGIDTGGTFTDVVITAPDGCLVQGKSPTTPKRVSEGVLAAISVAAQALGRSLGELLAATDLLVYGTTHATNAIVEGKIARTALLVTAGHPDVLTLREGTKANPFDFSTEFPAPYVPRSLTFEIDERIDAEGGVFHPLNEAQVASVIERLRALGVEAIGVCFLWSMLNPAHERRVAELLRAALPGVALSLSHIVSPTIREYRRASTTVIDASIKTLMQRHLGELQQDLSGAGFRGDLFIATSMGGVMQVEDIAERPVLTVRSGPSMAPVAGLAYTRELGEDNAIVCDTGGTTFEVSVVRDGRITTTRDTWLGRRDTGHIVAVSSVDTRSIGSGGGSIAWLDAGGMLRVGPESAGADPGPACYGRGGMRPTLTDAAAVLGYLRPDCFLDGRMTLDVEAARRVLCPLAQRLGLPVEEAAQAVLSVAHHNMVTAIEDITVREGIDPRESVLLAGGGAGGLAATAIADSLGCRRVLVPPTAGALSAAGTQLCDIVMEFSSSRFADLKQFDLDAVNRMLEELESDAQAFAEHLRKRGLTEFTFERFAEARYAHQVWELETPLAMSRFDSPEDIARLEEAFHCVHERVYGFFDRAQTVECPYWKLRLRARIRKPDLAVTPVERHAPARAGRAYFAGHGWVEIPILSSHTEGVVCLAGPAIIAEPYTTIVVPPAWRASRTTSGSFLLETG